MNLGIYVYLIDMSLQSLQNISGHNNNSSFLEFLKCSQKRKLAPTAHWMHSLNFFFKFTVAATADYGENGKLFSILKTNQETKKPRNQTIIFKRKCDCSPVLLWEV